MKKNVNFLSILIIFLVLNFLFQNRMLKNQVHQLSYSQFLQQLEKGNVEDLTIDSNLITGKFKESIEEKKEFRTTKG
jgi:cell division protease FtsH